MKWAYPQVGLYTGGFYIYMERGRLMYEGGGLTFRGGVYIRRFTVSTF